MRPVCHFELVETSDYLPRRAQGLLNELGKKDQIQASQVRCVEVKSVGTRVRNTKRFHVVNPTNGTFEFEWAPCGEPNSAWRCGTPKGMIISGKRGEMIFEYTPDVVGVAEAFFRFKIPAQGVDELFLFAGSVVEPRVMLDRTRVDFASHMVGMVEKETIHLVNNEHLPFSFAFDKESVSLGALSDEGKRPVIEISPMSGLLPPNGRTAIEVRFCPSNEKFVNLNVECLIRKKPTPLNLNVKGEGYGIHARLTLEETGGGGGHAIELMPAPAINHVDFGTVHLNEGVTKKVTVLNAGKFNFDYLFDRNTKNPMLMLTGGKTGGTVRKNDRVELNLVFNPVSATTLDGMVLTCTIAGKLEYRLQVAGRGVAPALHFSFVRYDFGPCFINKPGVPPISEETVLRVANHDPLRNISLDCTMEKSRVLEVRHDPCVLSPGEHVDIVLALTPRDQTAYAFPVPFLCNGSSTVTVDVFGRGVPARLELANPSQANVSFGAVREGDEAVRQVRLINRSARALPFELIDEEHLSAGRLEACDVRFFPRHVPALGVKEAVTLELRFAPRRRMAPFNEDLFVYYAGEKRKLLNVAGQSTGMDISLETDTLPFPKVCEGSQLTRKLQLENRGDMPARFRWQVPTFGQHFSISPVEGVVPAGSEFAFEVASSTRASSTTTCASRACGSTSRAARRSCSRASARACRSPTTRCASCSSSRACARRRRRPSRSRTRRRSRGSSRPCSRARTGAATTSCRCRRRARPTSRSRTSRSR